MRLRLALGKLPRLLALGLLTGATLLLGTPSEVQAASGYGGPQPPAPSVPGGYFAVVTSVTVGPSGRAIGPVRVGRVLITLRVPAGAFPVPVQITLTAPQVTGIGDGGFPGFSALGGVGIQVQQNGAAYPGVSLRPVILDITVPSSPRSDVVVTWNGTRFVADPAVTRAGDTERVTLDEGEDVAVLAPTTPIRGATSTGTGVPLLGEGLGAGTLILLGTAGLAVAFRRRAAG